MGGGSSTLNNNTIKTKNIVEAFSKTIQNCQGNTVINQKIAITGNYNVVKNVRLVQGMKLSSSCALDDKNVASAQQAVADAIKQQAESQNVAVLGALGGSASSETNTTIDNEVRATITRETIQNIINNFNATQDFYLNGNSNIVEDISMEQSMQVLYDNCLSALSQISSFQQVTNDVDQSSKSTMTNPISDIVNSVGNIFTKFGGMWTIIIIVGMIVGAIIIIQVGPDKLLALVDGDDDPPNQQSMQPYQFNQPMQFSQPPMQFSQPPMQFSQPMPVAPVAPVQMYQFTQ